MGSVLIIGSRFVSYKRKLMDLEIKLKVVGNVIICIELNEVFLFWFFWIKEKDE